MKKTLLMISAGGVMGLTALIAQTRVPVPGPTIINSPRPLNDASRLLRRLYGKVVTYEEPVRVWSGELKGINNRNPESKWGFEPQEQTFTMPADTGVNPDLSFVLNETIGNFHQQTQGIRFQMLSSPWGYHIVPVQAHDENGTLVPARSVLDTRITVPIAERQPQAQLHALAVAVQQATKVRVVDDTGAGSVLGWDGEFKKGGKSLTWGATDMVARDALISLLQQSETTYLWHLNCQFSAKAEDRYCVLNILKLEVAVTDSQGNRHLQVLRYDRCPNCAKPAAPGDSKTPQ